MKDERHETIEQSVTDCNHLGNAAKMREALSMILGTVEHLQTRFDMPKLASEEILELKQIAESAIAAPPRNCDVGTAEEQLKMFNKFCFPMKCKECQLYKDEDLHDCIFRWNQMPYEEGGSNGK